MSEPFFPSGSPYNIPGDHHYQQRPPAGNAEAQEAILQSLSSPGAFRLTPATLQYKITNGKWIPARHLRYIAAIIAAEVQKGNARIIVTMPARHGKSELLSVGTSMWALERWPEKHVILTSYGAELAGGHSRKVRDILRDRTDTLSVRLSDTSQRVDHFFSTQGGSMLAAGIGGPITGYGAHLLLVDDYLKNAEEALSKSQRDKIYEWYISTAFTRLEPGGSIIILATRWNIDDLIGRLLIEQPGVWTLINLPAIAYQKKDEPFFDPLGRQIGEALWPERFNIDALNNIRKTLTLYYWMALYQQDPVPRTGIAAGAIQTIEALPHYSRLRMVRYWDLAATEDAGDWTSGVKVAEDIATGDTIIVDIKRGQWSAAEVERNVRQTAENDGSGVPIGIEQEPGASGKTVISYYQRKILQGFSVKAFPSAGKKKVTRATPFLAVVENNCCKMLQASWNKDFADEVRVFPDGVHDDMVDSASGGYNMLHEKRFQGVSWGRNPGGVYVPSGPAETGSLITGVTFGRRRY